MPESNEPESNEPESNEVDLVIRGPEDVVSFLHDVRCADRRAGADPARPHPGRGRAHRPRDLRCRGAIRDPRRSARSTRVSSSTSPTSCWWGRSSWPPSSPAPGRARALRAGRFVSLRRDCADDGVVLLDWIVVAGHLWWSMREQVIHEAALTAREPARMPVRPAGLRRCRRECRASDAPVRAANAAFYTAFEGGDLDAMADVWEHSDRVSVTHPGWPTLHGWAQRRRVVGRDLPQHALHPVRAHERGARVEGRSPG